MDIDGAHRPALCAANFADHVPLSNTSHAEGGEASDAIPSATEERPWQQ